MESRFTVSRQGRSLQRRFFDSASAACIGKKLAVGLKAPPHMAIPYPAGIEVISDSGHDKLLIANNLSDNVVLLDPATGKILQTFDLSTSRSGAVCVSVRGVATKDGRRAWCSLWNSSQVAELDLNRRESAPLDQLKKPPRPAGSGFAPTAMLLSPDEKTAICGTFEHRSGCGSSNTEYVAPFGFSTRFRCRIKRLSAVIPIALAQSAGRQASVRRRLHRLDAVAVFDIPNSGWPQPELEKNASWSFLRSGIPARWRFKETTLLIATAKGTGATRATRRWEDRSTR